MIDYYLKFENEAEAQEKLTGYTGSIDVIGILHETVATSDPDNIVTKVRPGWHVNVRGPASEFLLPFSIQVTTPSRVWA